MDEPFGSRAAELCQRFARVSQIIPEKNDEKYKSGNDR